MEMTTTALRPAATQNTVPQAARIDILNTFFLRGPSIWTYRPILEAWIDIGELEDRPSNLIPGLYERLSAWLPGLIEHHCSPGVRGGFLKRLREGTWAGHILEHIAIELQVQAGVPAAFGQAREMSRRGFYKVVFRTPHEAIGRAALHEARELLLAAIDNQPFDVDASVRCLSHVVREHHVDASTACILEAAARRRIPAMQLSANGLVQLGYGKQQRRIWMNTMSLNSAIAEGIADDHKLARKMLVAAGVPMPDATAIHSIHDLREYWDDNARPLVLRPRNARSGGVVLPVTNTWNSVEAAYQEILEQDDDVFAEELVSGKEFRLLVADNRVVAALQLPAMRDVTQEVHADVAALATMATRVLGLEVAEVQLVAPTLSQSLSDTNGRVLAVRARVDLQRYIDVDPALGDKVGSAIIDHLFGEKNERQLPIVSVSGSNGTTEVAHAVARLLSSRYPHTGLACGDGLYLGARRLEQGDQTQWQATQRLLRNPALEAAVCEHRWESILSEGLGYDRSRIAIVMRVEENDLAPAYDLHTPEQMQKVTRTPVDVVLADGAAVLNADNAAADLARFCDGEVIYFSRLQASPLVTEHLASGGRAVFARKNAMVFANGVHTLAIPMDLHALPVQRLETLLAAAAAGWALDIAPQELCSSLAAVGEAAIAA